MAKQSENTLFEKLVQDHVVGFIKGLVAESSDLYTFVNRLKNPEFSAEVVDSFYLKYPEILVKNQAYIEELQQKQIGAIKAFAGAALNNLQVDKKLESDFRKAKKELEKEKTTSDKKLHKLLTKLPTGIIIDSFTGNVIPNSINICFRFFEGGSADEQERQIGRKVSAASGFVPDLVNKGGLSREHALVICDVIRAIDPIVFAVPNRVLEILPLLTDGHKPEEFLKAIGQIASDQHLIIAKFSSGIFGETHYKGKEDKFSQQQKENARMQYNCEVNLERQVGLRELVEIFGEQKAQSSQPPVEHKTPVRTQSFVRKGHLAPRELTQTMRKVGALGSLPMGKSLETSVEELEPAQLQLKKLPIPSKTPVVHQELSQTIRRVKELGSQQPDSERDNRNDVLQLPPIPPRQLPSPPKIPVVPPKLDVKAPSVPPRQSFAAREIEKKTSVQDLIKRFDPENKDRDPDQSKGGMNPNSGGYHSGF